MATSQHFQQGEAKLLQKLQKYAEKNVVLSTEFVNDFFEEYFGDEDGSEEDNSTEEHFDEMVKSLLDRGLIYKFGDKDSYLSLVRSQGKISLSEKRMMSALKKRKITFRDNEFPINEDGSYNIPINKVEFDNLVSTGQIASMGSDKSLSLFDLTMTNKLVKIVTKNGKIYYYLSQ